ncbi:hypothetical protein GMLC_19890 [Geomonas limicola]|uniref:DUF2292 domain-containing protein n=1 Tax=Geomonas limicola TaxID=2740186 RepID=A0A6V8N7Q1_9BACT|nr:YezD family protein [Geomonas limicola]GFO68410.1 hypothetical protein GMLC_19890 [Geomonas limicola]
MADSPTIPAGRLTAEVERALRDALRSIRFGTVTLVVQDGRVIQIERNEKFRFKSEHRDGSGI